MWVCPEIHPKSMVDLYCICVQSTVLFRTIGLRRGNPEQCPVGLSGDSPQRSERPTKYHINPKGCIYVVYELRNVMISPRNRELYAKLATSVRSQHKLLTQELQTSTQGTTPCPPPQAHRHMPTTPWPPQHAHPPWPPQHAHHTMPTARTFVP